MNRLLIIIWLLTACSFCIQLALDEKGKAQNKLGKYVKKQCAVSNKTLR